MDTGDTWGERGGEVQYSEILEHNKKIHSEKTRGKQRQVRELVI